MTTRRWQLLMCVGPLTVLGASVHAQTVHRVELDGIEFIPADITIDVGDTVHWVWISGFHNVESGVVENGVGSHDGVFRSGNPGFALTYDLTFDQALLDANPAVDNRYPYFCVVHASVDMTGSVTVRPAVACTTEADCADGNACNGVERCLSGECTTGAPLNCDDGNPCTRDACDAESGCVYIPDDNLTCDDGNVCNGLESCHGGLCSARRSPECDDFNPCTTDSCDPAAGCMNLPNDGNLCDDGDRCNGLESCQDGICVPGEPPDCDDGNACTDDGCDPATGCTNTSNDENDCDDEDLCTEDACLNGHCMSTAIPGCVGCVDNASCDDGNRCTDGVCRAGTCVFIDNTVACDDGDPCTVDDRCARGVCMGAGASACCHGDTDCDDADRCTQDECVENACVYEPIDGCGEGEAEPEAVSRPAPRLCGAVSLVCLWGTAATLTVVRVGRGRHRRSEEVCR